jgi:putative flavoprotein involved in K+ transport
VVLAVGRHARMPRRYRGRDIWHWLTELGMLEHTLADVPHERDASRSPSLALSGADGGEHLDLTSLAAAGVVVTGRLRGFSGRHALFGDDLRTTVEESDRRMRRLLEKIDSHIDARRGSEPAAAEPIPPVTLPPGQRVVDLEAEGISTVIWATGYRRSYPWLDIDVLGEDGEIAQTCGVTAVSGLYTLGLRFQHRRKSHFIGGVSDDARFLAAEILARSSDVRAA